jgi:predicted enzyme related to lactoylglutathione lyase
MGPRYDPGTFCWVGLATSDPPRATAFYCDLFGWDGEEIEADQLGTPTLLRRAGREVAILYRQTAEARAARVRPHWTSFISVEDADEASARARELGGAEVREPFDAGDAGRVTTVRDPTGAIVSLWQAGALPGAAAGPGHPPWWNELLTSDLAAVKSFFAEFVGWEYETDASGFTTVTKAGEPIAGMRERGGRANDPPVGWLPYFMVEALDAAARQAQARGGQTAEDAPTGRRALITDPQGAVFGVLEGGGPSRFR